MSKGEMVAASLRDYIIENRLKPGDRLPTEGELEELYGVSRVSIRAATNALSFLGIVDAAPCRGLSVGKISMKRISQYLGFHFAVSDYPMDELISTRSVIETGGLEQLARRMAEDPNIYEQLNEINEQLRSTKSMEDWIQRDMKFHCSLVSSTGLNALAAFNELLQIFFQHFREDFPRAKWNDGVAEHQKIIDFLRDGDSDSAAKCLKSHIGSHTDRMEHTSETSPS